MDAEPFDSGSQLHTFELLDEHRAPLVENAREMLRERPDAEILGLVLDGDAEEALAFRRAIELATGQDLGNKGFLGVVPRHFVVDRLRREAPASLEWLPSSTTRDEHGDLIRWLPLVAMTRDGIRFGAVRLDPDYGDNDGDE